MKGGHLAGKGYLSWVVYKPICSPLGTLEAWTGAGVSCHCGTVAAIVWVMVQSLWGGATHAIWVGKAINAVGCSLTVGAANQIILELEYGGLDSMVVC